MSLFLNVIKAKVVVVMTDMIQFNVGDTDVVFDSVKARGSNVVFELIVESWRRYYICIYKMS